MNEVKADHHEAVKKIVQENSTYESLMTPVNDWIGYYENLKEEEEEWNECLRADSGIDEEINKPMYGGVSDDWWEYLDKIGYDKRYDLDD